MSKLLPQASFIQYKMWMTVMSRIATTRALHITFSLVPEETSVDLVHVPSMRVVATFKCDAILMPRAFSYTEYFTDMDDKAQALILNNINRQFQTQFEVA